MARTTDNASASATSANSSITNVAALANVSIATVSRVLSGKRTKDDDIARRVRAAAAHLNYSVNYAASALRSTVTNTIGLVIPTANDPFCAQLLDEIEPVIDVDSQQLLLGIGGAMVIGGSMSLGDLVAFTGYIWMITDPMRILGNLINMLTQAITSAEKLFYYEDLGAEIRDKEHTEFPKPFRGHVRFDHVTFGYGDETVLRDLCLDVPAGTTCAIMGATGTGKTFAFGIPIIEHIEPGSEETEAVILAPTRELAMQITAELRDLCVYLPGVRIVCLYGGAPIGKQIDALKKHPQIVVATPGRLSDHMKRRTVKLDNVKTVVLDEADRMLDMGFIHDVTRILDKLSSRRNLGMFSATISREVMDISWMYQRDPEEITVQAKEENKPDIAQYRIDVGQNDKAHVMAQIIRAEGHERVMAFCNTKGMTERLKAFLMMEGLEADCIHGDIPQKKREAVMARFRRGELPIFVATDVAARGIDVDDVDAVFNYDVPLENEYYVHRIGRTGRAKRRGVAYTLVSDYPSGMRLDEIAKFTGNEVKKAHLDAEGKLVED